MSALLSRDNLLLLRLPFSFFLLPIFAFSVLVVVRMGQPLHPLNTWLVFVIVHLLVYPASNAYNSWMDQDQGPIGALRTPPPARRSLYHLSIVLDAFAVLLAMCMQGGIWFALATAGYIGVSKAYSWHGIRLKKFPFGSWLTVAAVQGGYTFLLFVSAAAAQAPWHLPPVPVGLGAVAAFFLVGAMYPLTQIFQHQEDAQRGDRTLSQLLGIRGTFVFSGGGFTLGLLAISAVFWRTGHLHDAAWMALGLAPVLGYFLWWAVRAWHNPAAASFAASLRMNVLAAACLCAVFFARLLA